MNNADNIYYNSYKDERDLILEYNQVSLNDVNKVDLFGIKIDNYSSEQAVVKVMDLIDNGGVHQIKLLNPYKIQKIKSNPELDSIFRNSDLLLASGSGIEWSCRMLNTPIKERISPLSFIMDLIRISELKEYTIFFVGAKPEIVEHAYANIKKSFPKIRIVGRHGGYFNQQREKSVVEAMRKSEANIVFVGLGFPKEDKWVKKISKEFENTVFITIGGSIDTISGEIKKAPASSMEKGSDWFYRIITRPWRIGRLFRVVIFVFHILWKKLFHEK